MTQVVTLNNKNFDNVKLLFEDLNVEDHISPDDDWINVVFIVEVDGHLPPSVNDIDMTSNEYRKLGKATSVGSHKKLNTISNKNYIKRRDQIIDNTFSSIQIDYNFTDPDSTTFSFDCMANEITYINGEFPATIYNLCNRRYREDGISYFIIKKVIYYPKGKEYGAPPSLYIEMYKYNKYEQNYSIELNTGFYHAPIIQYFNPREEAVAMLRGFGMTDNNIHALDGLITICRLEKIKKVEDPTIKMYFLKFLHDQKYYVEKDIKVSVVEYKKNRRGGKNRPRTHKKIEKTIIRKIKSARTLKFIDVSHEDPNMPAYGSIAKLVWCEDYIDPPNLKSTTIEKMKYLKYYESIPVIRW